MTAKQQQTLFPTTISIFFSNYFLQSFKSLYIFTLLTLHPYKEFYKKAFLNMNSIRPFGPH